MSAPVTDHTVQALADLLGEFDDSPRFRELITALVDRSQEFEDLAQEVLAEMLLTVAVGLPLEVYGVIMQEPRGSLSDADYRNVLNVKAAAVQSDGEAPKTIWVASTLLGVAVQYRWMGRAAYHLEWEIATGSTGDWLARIISILDILPPAGVDYTAVEGDSTGAGAFRFDIGPGFDVGKLGEQIV